MTFCQDYVFSMKNFEKVLKIQQHIQALLESTCAPCLLQIEGIGQEVQGRQERMAVQENQERMAIQEVQEKQEKMAVQEVQD